MYRGAVGELCVYGPLVGQGYLNRESLTSEKFPTLDWLGERIYRTGDLVRLLHDGSFDFIGRSDEQIKLRGQRLEAGEINAVIRNATHEVDDVTTLVLKHPKQQRDQLVSFIVFSGGVKSDFSVIFEGSSITASSKTRVPGKITSIYDSYSFCPHLSNPIVSQQQSRRKTAEGAL